MTWVITGASVMYYSSETEKGSCLGHTCSTSRQEASEKEPGVKTFAGVKGISQQLSHEESNWWVWYKQAGAS